MAQPLMMPNRRTRPARRGLRAALLLAGCCAVQLAGSPAAGAEDWHLGLGGVLAWEEADDSRPPAPLLQVGYGGRLGPRLRGSVNVSARWLGVTGQVGVEMDAAGPVSLTGRLWREMGFAGDITCARGWDAGLIARLGPWQLGVSRGARDKGIWTCPGAWRGTWTMMVARWVGTQWLIELHTTWIPGRQPGLDAGEVQVAWHWWLDR